MNDKQKCGLCGGRCDMGDLLKTPCDPVVLDKSTKDTKEHEDEKTNRN